VTIGSQVNHAGLLENQTKQFEGMIERVSLIELTMQ